MQEVERLFAIVGDMDLVHEVGILEGGEDELDVVGVVLGEEDGAGIFHAAAEVEVAGSEK